MLMTDLPGALAILSAMLTPAVLISACGSLILTTSQRLGRATDRARTLSDRLTDLARPDKETEPLVDERTVLFELLRKQTQRARLLQHALTSFYVALSIFVATSVAIGVVAVTGRAYAWMAILLGLAGAALLFYGSLILIRETRIALTVVDDEMDFVLRISQYHTSAQLIAERKL